MRDPLSWDCGGLLTRWMSYVRRESSWFPLNLCRPVKPGFMDIEWLALYSTPALLGLGLHSLRRFTSRLRLWPWPYPLAAGGLFQAPPLSYTSPASPPAATCPPPLYT